MHQEFHCSYRPCFLFPLPSPPHPAWFNSDSNSLALIQSYIFKPLWEIQENKSNATQVYEDDGTAKTRSSVLNQITAITDKKKEITRKECAGAPRDPPRTEFRLFCFRFRFSVLELRKGAVTKWDFFSPLSFAASGEDEER